MTTGFASPADDYLEGRLSLDALLIQNKESTFFVRAKGYSMKDAGIFDGDLLVVDKSLTPTSGNVIIAVVDGELAVRRLIKQGGQVSLQAANPEFAEILLKDEQELQVWGVVTATIKRFV
jgi:DNA polymerase V